MSFKIVKRASQPNKIHVSEPLWNHSMTRLQSYHKSWNLDIFEVPFCFSDNADVEKTTKKWDLKKTHYFWPKSQRVFFYSQKPWNESRTRAVLKKCPNLGNFVVSFINWEADFILGLKSLENPAVESTKILRGFSTQTNRGQPDNRLCRRQSTTL